MISSRPKSVTAYLGQSATLSARATGGGLTYQWSKDGVSMPGRTANTLTIKPLTLKSAGTYKVTVSNIAGSDSAEATVVVHGPPVLEMGLSNATVNAGMFVRLEVDVRGEGVSFAWFKDGVNLPGELDRFLLKPFELADAGRYTVTITNPAGSVSSSATVTVIDVAPGLAWNYLGRIREPTGLNEVYTVTLTGRANRAMTWTWNLLHTGCILLPPTADWMGSGTIAAGTPAGTQVRRLSFGIYGIHLAMFGDGVHGLLFSMSTDLVDPAAPTVSHLANNRVQLTLVPFALVKNCKEETRSLHHRGSRPGDRLRRPGDTASRH